MATITFGYKTLAASAMKANEEKDFIIKSQKKNIKKRIHIRQLNQLRFRK